MQPIVGDAVSLQTALDARAGRVRVDPVQLQQVLMNLIVNAVDAMPDGGPLLIATSRIDANSARRRELPDLPPGEVVEIVVRDVGSGMTDDVRGRAFEPFFTTKGIARGTGLGLSTSYGIVSQAGGTMEIVSEVGLGTSVHVLLPVTSGQATIIDDVVSTPQERLDGSETILVVDDDPGVLRVTSASLRRFGYVVIEARSGEQALAASRRETGVIHLLVTDVVMPGMSGRALADAVLRERPTTRVLFVSGYPDGTIAHHGVVHEGVALLSKPYERAELARRVRTLLDGIIPIA
jgi:CheY-like chemotaxis protein